METNGNESKRSEDERPWMDKATFMSMVGRSERTVQQWVSAGTAERQLIDGRAFYRLAAPAAPRNTAAVQHPLHPEDTPAWAKDLRDEIQALRSELAAMRSTAAPLPAAAPRDTPEKRNWLRRLLRLG
jgi:hypothetical protein